MFSRAGISLHFDSYSDIPLGFLHSGGLLHYFLPGSIDAL